MKLHVNSLKVLNFRCFEECHVEFHPWLTVLVGDNGRGKTTLLDATALALAEFVDLLTQERQSVRVTRRDVRVKHAEGGGPERQLPVHVGASGEIDGWPVSWCIGRTRRAEAARNPTRSALQLQQPVRSLRRLVQDGDADDREIVLPVVAYYRSSRFVQSNFFSDGSRQRRRTLEGRLSGYRSFLDPLAEAFHFNKWFQQTWEGVRGSSAFGARHVHSPLRLLTAVRGAVAEVLAPVGKDASLNWDADAQSVTVDTPGRGPLPLAMLSTGVRNTVALVADLAQRCCRLNPALGGEAAILTPGVVLIDEVDLHLHPAWQQEVVVRLRAAFPNVQFVLTTHSPQVLSTVHAQSIRTIKMRGDVGEVEVPKYQTRGVESADVLAAVMNVDPVPKVEEAALLSEYRTLIETGAHDRDDGKAMRRRLDGHFGPKHPLILDCDRLIRFSLLKRKATGGK